jgi:hypothetical protein
MPVSLSELQSNVRSIVVEYDNDKVAITYKPAMLTAASSAEFTKQGVVAQLETLLVSWDVLDEKGKALPVSTELLNQMPGRFLTHLVNAINEDMRPNSTRAAN